MTKRYIVEVDDVPPSPSPISNAVVVGNQCWIGGQLSVGSMAATYRARRMKKPSARLRTYSAKLPIGGRNKVQAIAAR